MAAAAPRWQVSAYTAAFSAANGDLVLVNSFMGSLMRVGEGDVDAVRDAIASGIEEHAWSDPVLHRLCEHGYFVRSSAEESEVVREILKLERDAQGFSLILMPHENCNFRCAYCYEKFERGKMSRAVVEGLKAFVRHSSQGEWKSLAVQWFGGEPLLAKDVIEELSDSFIESCGRAGIAFTAGITTNGSLLSPAASRMLLDRHVRRFQITLDGPAETHDVRRHLAGGGNTYSAIFENLIVLQQLPETYVVRLRVNFDPDSIELIERWIREIGPLFAHDERFQISFHSIGRWGGPNDAALHVCDDETASSAKRELLETAYIQGFSRGTMRDFLGAHGSSCYAGKESSVVVGSDGTLYKCTVAFDDPRNQVGRLIADGTLQIDSSRWNLWVKTDHLDTDKCTSCWFHASCESRTCPLVALDEGNPPCPTTQDEMHDLVELTTYGKRITHQGSHTARLNPGRRQPTLLPIIAVR